MKGSSLATMSPKLNPESQPAGDNKIISPFKDADVPDAARSAADMSLRVNPKADVNPNHSQPLPGDVEVGPVNDDAGKLMLGVKLTRGQFLTAWLAVFILTLAAILAQLGNLILSYFSEQMSQDIGMTDAQYGVLQGYSYFLVQGIAMVIQGYIVDRYALNRMYVVGFGAMVGAAALLIQGFAKDFNVMLIGLVLSALGSSVFSVLPIPILSDMLPPEQISFGGAINAANPYLAEFLAGNLAELCLKKSISWRWAIVGLGAACAASSVAIFAFLREPPIGRFIIKKEGEHEKTVCTIRDVVTYMVAMRSFWILTIACGLRQIPGDMTGSYMPSFYSAVYPDQSTVFTAVSTIVGLGGLAAALIYGAICQRFYTRLPTISLYTTAIGAILAAGCVAISILSRVIAGGDSNKGYAIGLTAMTLAFLLGEGWSGTVGVMLTLALPPVIRSFAIALFFALGQVIGPAGSVLFGIYLTAGDWVKGMPEYIVPARIYMLVSLIFGYLGSALLFWLAAPSVLKDMHLREEAAKAGGYPDTKLRPRRQIAFIVGGGLLVLAVLTLIIISFIFSYAPQMIVHPRPHGLNHG